MSLIKQPRLSTYLPRPNNYLLNFLLAKKGFAGLSPKANSSTCVRVYECRPLVMSASNQYKCHIK